MVVVRSCEWTGQLHGMILWSVLLLRRRERDNFATTPAHHLCLTFPLPCFLVQLNIYGFHKTRHDEDSCEFKQPNFRRGVPHLVGLIRRKGPGNNASAAGVRHSEGNNNTSKVI